MNLKTLFVNITHLKFKNTLKGEHTYSQPVDRGHQTNVGFESR